MNEKIREEVVTNYYKASNALIQIGTINGLPEDLKELCLKASSVTSKIIDYVNENK